MPRRKARPDEAPVEEEAVATHSIQNMLPVAFVASAVALALRLLYLYQVSDSPGFSTPVVDAAAYDHLARELLATGSPGKGFFWQPPFYPAFLALVYALSGGSIAVAKIAQAFLGAATCGLTALLGGYFFGRRWMALLAGLIPAVYGPLIFFEGELLATGWAALASVLLVVALALADRRPGLATGAFLGLCGALATLIRPTFLLVVVVGATWILWRARGSRRSLLAVAAGLALGFLPLTLGFATLGAKTADHPSFLPASGGLNLYLGNHPESCELLNARPGTEWQRLVEEPRRAGVTGFGAESRYFYRRALENALEDPAGFFSGLGQKVSRLFSSRALPRNTDPYLFRAESSVLAVTLWKIGPFGFPFGLLLPLAAIGLVFGRRLPWPVPVFLGVYALGIVLVFVAARYRVAMVPILGLAATAGVAELAHLRGRRLGAALALVGVLLLLSIWPGPFCEEEVNYAAELQYALGFELGARGDGAAAESHYLQALELDSDLADARYNLGLLFAERGDRDAALEAFRAAAESDPSLAVAHASLGVELARSGEREAAIAAFIDAVNQDPQLLLARAYLGRLLLEEGDPQSALEHLLWASRAEPENARHRDALGTALLHLGRVEEGIEHLRRAADLDSEWPAPFYRLGWVLATHPEAAVRNGRHALAYARQGSLLTGDRHPIFLDALAAAYAEVSQFENAVSTQELALRFAQEGGADARALEPLRQRLELYRSGQPHRDSAIPEIAEP